MFLLNPLQLKDEPPSIRQPPRTSLVKHMSELRCAPSAPVHSIIGDRGKNNTPYSSDGIVSHSSSHLIGASAKNRPIRHSVRTIRRRVWNSQETWEHLVNQREKC